MESPVEEILTVSGIESIINSQQPTPNKSEKENSLNSTEDPFSFASKNLRFSPSPVKPLVADDLLKDTSASSTHSDLQQLSAFTKSAQEIQKRIQNSLISSLKLEQATMPILPVDNDKIDTDKTEETDDMKGDVADAKPDEVPLMNRHTDEVIEFNQSQTVSQFLANFKKLNLTGQLEMGDDFEKPNSRETNLSEFLNKMNTEVTMEQLLELTGGNEHVKVDQTSSLNPEIEKTSTLKKPAKQSAPRSKVPNKQTSKSRKPQSSFTVNKRPSNKVQKVQQATRLSLKAASKSKAASKDKRPMIDSIRSMEAVRDQLQNMLKMDPNAPPEQLSLESSPMKEHRHDVSALVDNLCSGDGPSQSVGLMDMFKPQINQQVDSGLLAEKQMLTESLEKERYRRKHCERQISELQSKLLDTQQELAVVSSTMQKKDTMIEHLDKTLAQVVGGWKNHEATVARTLQQTVSENKQMKSDIATQKQLITELRDELMKAVDALNHEKQMHQRKNDDMSKLKHTFQQKVTEISRVIDQKNSSLEQLLKDKENSVHEIKQLMTKLEEKDNNYKVMQDHFNEKEKEFDEKFSDKLQRQEHEFHSLKESLQHEKQRSVELERNLSSAQEDFNKLDDLLGNTRQELEEARMQQNILITKHEAEMKNLSAQQKVEVEKQINMKMTRIHTDVQRTEDELRQNHKKQIHDLNEGHLSELQSQCRQYEDRLQQKDTECKKILTENEARFSQLLRDRTENMRRQMMMKMRNLMQAHCNETLQLMGNTTGMTPARPLYTGFDRSLYEDNFDTSINETTLNKSSSYLPKSLQFPMAHSRPDDHYEPSMSALASNVAQSHETTSAFAMYNMLPATFNQSHVVHKHVTSPQKPLEHDTTSPKAQPTAGNNFHDASSGVPSRYLSPNKTPQSNGKTTADRTLSEISSVNNSAEKSISEKLADHETRKKSLQKYIEMLLHRAPGDPLNISQPSPLASFDHTPSSSAPPTYENKENSQQQSVAMEMSHLLEASTQATTNPSPDVIPSSHDARTNDNNTSLRVSSASAFTQSKVQNKNVHFTTDRSITVKMPVVEATQTPFTSKEVSDISDMLSCYTQNTTPSGETKEAAQRLLAYLNDYKQQSKTQESTRNSTTNPVKIKSRTNTPSKCLPAWR